MITRCVGANSDVVPDVYTGTLESNDVFVLASDGLTGMLEDHELLSILNDEAQPAVVVDSMIAEANRRGGLDNITVIVIRIDEIG